MLIFEYKLKVLQKPYHLTLNKGGRIYREGYRGGVYIRIFEMLSEESGSIVVEQPGGRRNLAAFLRFEGPGSVSSWQGKRMGMCWNVFLGISRIKPMLCKGKVE